MTIHNSAPKRRIDVRSLKRAINPVQFYARQNDAMPSPKSASGWVRGGLCPFHDDKKQGNFRVHCESGAFRCFSCGAKGGDVISYVQHRDQCDFRTAAETLMREYGPHYEEQRDN